MSDDNLKQPGVRIDQPLWERFRERVKGKYGGVRGHLRTELENAIRNHIHTDQPSIEDELRTIREEITALREGVTSSENSGSETDSVSKTTENRISEIMADIRDRSDELGSKRVSESDVEAAIERHAGTSYKTIQRYKNLLQNQRAIFAHPNNQDIYFVGSTAFIAFVEQGVPTHEASEIRAAFGDEWWLENAPDGMLNEDKRGFQ